MSELNQLDPHLQMPLLQNYLDQKASNGPVTAVLTSRDTF